MTDKNGISVQKLKELGFELFDYDDCNFFRIKVPLNKTLSSFLNNECSHQGLGCLPIESEHKMIIEIKQDLSFAQYCLDTLDVECNGEIPLNKFKVLIETFLN